MAKWRGSRDTMLGYVPLSQPRAELLLAALFQRYERGSAIVTSNLPSEERTRVEVSLCIR